MMFKWTAVAMVIGWSVALGPSWGHEGHQPLPTHGVQIDLERGYLALSSRARDLLGVETTELKFMTVRSEIQAYVVTKSPWNGHAFATPWVAGRILHLHARPGDRVERGQLLAELASREGQQWKLAYDRAHRAAKLSEDLLQVARTTATAGAIPTQRLIEAENQHLQDLNAVELLRVRGNLLGVDPSELEKGGSAELTFPVRSPIDGIVVSSDLVVGKYIEPSEHIFEIVDEGRLWGELQLLEKDLTKVEAGQSVHFDFPSRPGKSIDGTIQSRLSVLGPDSRYGLAWAALHSQDSDLESGRLGPENSKAALVPGLVGRATIETESAADRLVVPEAAVFGDGLQHYVFVEVASTKSSGEYVRKSVRLGHRVANADSPSSKHLEVLSGDVFPGDRVVIRGGHELSSLFFLGSIQLEPRNLVELGIQFSLPEWKPIRQNLVIPAMVSVPPSSRQSISPQLSGRLTRVAVEPGQWVRVGDELGELTSSEFQNLQLEFLQSYFEAQLLRDQYQRLSASSPDVVAKRILIESLSRAERLEQSVASLRNQLKTLGLDDDHLQSILDRRSVYPSLILRSWLEGEVTRFHSILGESVQANEPIFEILNPVNYWVEALVPADRSLEVSVGDTAVIRSVSSSDRRWLASISRMSPILNEANRTRSIWLLPRDQVHGWHDQMMATAIVHGPESELKWSIPQSAIVRDGRQAFVMIQTSGGKIDRRRVETGTYDEERIEILGGIGPDELVVVQGAAQLNKAYVSLR